MRWLKLRRHPEQIRLWTENKRFAVVYSGRRSGKTELAKRRLVLGLQTRKKWPDPRYFAAAPTRAQAKRIFWKDLKALTPLQWIKRIYEADLCITTQMGSELWVVGLDRPQRIEGAPWDGGVLDEFADMRPHTWAENIRPALSDRNGWCWIIGVPEGINHYKELVDYAASGEDSDWGVYKWRSSDILPAGEIDAARRLLDPRTFRQEYEGSFEGKAGRVYYAYDAQRHEDKTITLKVHLPVILCCDFNVGACVWEILQTDGRAVWVVDEIVFQNTNTVEMGKEVLRRWGHPLAGFIVYGDAAGSNRTTAGKSDYALLQGLGFKDQRIKRANPLVRDRINAVNAMLENTDGAVRLYHHPGCKMLRKDFETVVWRDGGGEVNKGDVERTHATDALGYFIESEFPLSLHRPDPLKRFYK
ncbi:MAG: hypothetical protein HY884_09750 [Deltaproteobacteria bacterium]|nr:hypothetical protein [Deltaproteobacteria bacterium]